MMKTLTFIFILITASFSAAMAQEKPAPAPAKTPAPTEAKKTNQRPSGSAAKKDSSEPFDKADAKTMAAQCVTLETEAGNIELEFFPESAPESVRNFLNLSKTGAFDGTTFSRVVPGFVIQGGDLSTGAKWTHEIAARAARSVIDEPSQIKHVRGILSMARGAEPNSATTSFFILIGEASHLDGTFAAFGRVTKGMEIADEINKMPVENEKPKNPVRLKRAIVAACPTQNSEQSAVSSQQKKSF